MALDERYIVASDIEQYYVDKDSGLPLAAGTLEFFRDAPRSTPKPVYQLSGAPPNYTYTSMGAVITLSSVGTVQNAGADNEVIYYYPFDADGNLDLYYIVCRDSNGVEQFSREAWPNITASMNPTGDQFPITNQIANSQFINVFINEGYTTTYSVSAATNQIFSLGPEWNFMISGTGNVTVQRLPVSGNENIVTSPPYVLDITVSSGISSCKLRQRFRINSGLWASTDTNQIFLSGTVVARNEGAGTSGIQMFYEESSGGSPILIVDSSFDNSSFSQLTGVTAAPIPLSNNSDDDGNGFVDIYLSFLSSSHIRISSIQVVPTTDQAGAQFLNFDLNSSNRDEAFQGSYYIPRLNQRRAASLLIAWDFVNNPFQFGTSGNLSTSAGYICDQTIGLRGSSGNVAWSIDARTNGLKFLTAGSNDAFYLMQYMTPSQAKKTLGTFLSVNVNGYRTSVSSDVTMRVYLFRAPTATAIPTLPTSIGTVATDGTFTLTAAGWTEVPRSGLDTAKSVLPFLSVNSDINNSFLMDVGFTGWQITDNAQIGDTTRFAVVVTFAYVSTSTALTINSVSLIPNAIPSRPSPQSREQVIEECQFYYEKSYSISAPEATITPLGARVLSTALGVSAGSAALAPRSFNIPYNTIKRTNPTVRLYSPTSATVDQIALEINLPGTGIVSSSLVPIAANYVQANVSEKSITYHANLPTLFCTAVVDASNEGYLTYHYAADARLGVV